MDAITVGGWTGPGRYCVDRLPLILGDFKLQLNETIKKQSKARRKGSKSKKGPTASQKIGEKKRGSERGVSDIQRVCFGKKGTGSGPVRKKKRKDGLHVLENEL